MTKKSYFVKTGKYFEELNFMSSSSFVKKSKEIYLERVGFFVWTEPTKKRNNTHDFSFPKLLMPSQQKRYSLTLA